MKTNIKIFEFINKELRSSQVLDREECGYQQLVKLCEQIFVNDGFYYVNTSEGFFHVRNDEEAEVYDSCVVVYEDGIVKNQKEVAGLITSWMDKKNILFLDDEALVRFEQAEKVKAELREKVRNFINDIANSDNIENASVRGQLFGPPVPYMDRYPDIISIIESNGSLCYIIEEDLCFFDRPSGYWLKIESLIN